MGAAMLDELLLPIKALKRIKQNEISIIRRFEKQLKIILKMYKNSHLLLQTTNYFPTICCTSFLATRYPVLGHQAVADTYC